MKGRHGERDVVTGGQGENIEGLNILTFKSSIWQLDIVRYAPLRYSKVYSVIMKLPLNLGHTKNGKKRITTKVGV